MPLCRTTATRERITNYAAADDFCRIFDEQMKGLYMLSFLLTADPGKAEQCFISSLEDCKVENRVFKEWAHRWARRTIIQNAIRVIAPFQKQPNALNGTHLKTGGKPAMATENDALLTALVELEPSQRFVFVMSMLERYTDQDCSILLGCSRAEVVKIRVEALDLLASHMNDLRPELYCNAAQQATAPLTAGGKGSSRKLA